MKKAFLLGAAILAISFNAANAQVTESFTNLNGFTSPTVVDPATNNSTIPGAQFESSFFNPVPTISNVNPFLPTSGKYFSLNSTVDTEVRLPISPALAGTAGTVYVAFALRINSLSVTAAENNTDVFRILDSGGNLFGVVVRANTLRMAGTNGWPASAQIVTDVSTLTAGQWSAFALVVNQSTTAGAASVAAYSINTTTGATALLQEYTGITNTAVGDIAAIRFGATYRDGGTPAGADISIDEVLIAPASAYANTAAFLAAVSAAYSTSTVADWSAF